ncbi:hypothetical protein BGX29_012260 [Mortierella sp. GBA35]|nr:hypothetical protein BGX29_012260 [Mortierella sp. GBA35]
MCALFQVMPLIAKFTNAGVHKAEPLQQSGAINTSLFSSPDRKAQYTHLGQQLEQWRDQIPVDYDPWRARINILWVDMNSIGLSTYYFVLQILLRRPILIRATTLVQANMEVIQSQTIERGLQNETDRDGDQEDDEDGVEGDDNGNENDGELSDYLDPEEEKVIDDDRALLQIALETCSLAANEIVAIIEHYSHDWIKYRGNNMSYQVFIAATVHIMILFSSRNPTQLARAKQ